MTDVAVGLLSVPCEPLVPETLHVTPAFLESFVTVAVIEKVWASSMPVELMLEFKLTPIG